MIPLKLYLKNFLSYGPQGQTIDFEPYHLICLNGKNGHGKSALLDALTWALWGQARKIGGTAKPDSHLLRLGQTQMMVIFDFIFNNQTYRIKREYNETYGKPYAALDFALIDPETQKTRPLTDKTIKATQEKIEQMIGLDFDSFINSAFLRQGQSNEFSKKSPKERKDILATILSLQQYELLRKKALEKAKQATLDNNYLEQTQERLNNHLASLPSLTHELALSTEHLVRLEQELAVHHQELEKIQELKKKYQEIEAALSMVSFKKEQITTQKNTKQENLRSLFNTWRTIHRKKRRLNDLSREQERKSITSAIDQYQKTLQQTLDFKERYLACKEQEQKIVQEKNQEYQVLLNQHQNALERLRAEQQTLIEVHQKYQEEKHKSEQEYETVCRTIRYHEQQIHNLEAQGITKKTLETKFEKRKTRYHAWVAQLHLLEQELLKLDQKKMLAHDTTNPSCPLCEQNLSASRKRFLQTKFSTLETTYCHKINRFKRVLKNLKPILIQNHAELEQYQKKEQEITVHQLTLKDLLLKKETAQCAIKNIDTENATLITRQDTVQKNIELAQKKLEDLKTNVATTLTNDSAYQQLQRDLAAITTAQKTINYHQQDHQNALKRLEELEKEHQEDININEELVLQKQRSTDVRVLCQDLKKLNHELAAITAQQTALQEKYQEVGRHLINETELKSKIALNLQTKESLLQRKGSLEQQHKTLQTYHEELKNAQEQSKLLKNNADDFVTIAHALSKDGVQALLIEDALPEIEFEANELLSQLTNNQAHIIIESLRDLKKGGTKETLDIKISDPMGIRPYELFSGGEAFRIDFALRIAISKLLARRAGTSLQTLIIDEGFGSQDEEGIAHMMEALHKIQDSFAKIIIVSHLSSMKEQFPVHFLIEKGSQGSIIQIMEH